MQPGSVTGLFKFTPSIFSGSGSGGSAEALTLKDVLVKAATVSMGPYFGMKRSEKFDEMREPMSYADGTPREGSDNRTLGYLSRIYSPLGAKLVPGRWKEQVRVKYTLLETTIQAVDFSKPVPVVESLTTGPWAREIVAEEHEYWQRRDQINAAIRSKYTDPNIKIVEQDATGYIVRLEDTGRLLPSIEKDIAAAGMAAAAGLGAWVLSDPRTINSIAKAADGFGAGLRGLSDIGTQSSNAVAQMTDAVLPDSLI